MELKSPGVVFIILITIIVGTIFFAHGFFSFLPNTSERAKRSSIPNHLGEIRLNTSSYSRRVSNVILMIIDAFKYDFVSVENMRYVSEQLKNENACLLRMKVDIPTVTMPRIKSMMTGTVSNFMDIVLNLGNTEVLTDSVLHQMYDRGDHLVFYGDNTWTKLFPDMFYRKQENYDSFYVHDFHSGDKNITKWLSSEFKHHNWDMLILHYLGLDHIGHVEGSFSTKIYDKLSEMDRVIQQIHTSASVIERNEKLPPLFIVTSDHGMRDTGGHGGSTIGEIFIPLIAFSTGCSNKSYNDAENIFHNQIDIAPTLAVLLGFPIPEASIGCVLTELIDVLDYEDQLFALYYNTDRLVKKAIQKFGMNTINATYYYKQYELALNFHAQFLRSTKGSAKNTFYHKAMARYRDSCQNLSGVLSSSFTHFDMFSILIGVVHIVYASILLVAMTVFFVSERHAKPIKLLSNILIAGFIGILIRLSACEIFASDSELCSSRWHYYAVFVVLALIAFANIRIFATTRFQRRDKPYIYLVTVFHACTLFSSSFIEEEHQTWYYIASTSLLVLFLMEMKYFKLETMNIRWSEAIDNFLRHKKRSSSFVSGGSRRGESITANLRKIDIMLSYMFSWTIIFALFAFVRRLNQTGDKWLSVRDIGDWMVEHKLTLSFLFFISLVFLVYVLKDFNGLLTNILNFTAILLIYHYRTITGSVLLFDFKESTSKTSLIIFWLNIVEIYAINYLPALHRYLFHKEVSPQSVKNCLGAHVTAFSLISALLHKPHNAILVPVCVWTLERCFKSCDKLFRENNAVMYKVILSYWLGRAFFFLQGNSNNLASIDLTPGYIGLDSYNPIIVGLLVTINTYSGPILCYILLLHNVFNESDMKKNSIIIGRVIYITATTAVFPLAIYIFVMTLMRSHIFIWTVFSPKILYEFFNTYLYFTILLITFVGFKIVNVTS